MTLSACNTCPFQIPRDAVGDDDDGVRDGADYNSDGDVDGYDNDANDHLSCLRAVLANTILTDNVDKRPKPSGASLLQAQSRGSTNGAPHPICTNTTSAKPNAQVSIISGSTHAPQQNPTSVDFDTCAASSF